MSATLESIIPYLQEDIIEDVSFTLLLKLLSNQNIINWSSNVEQNTLLVRILSLLKSNKSVNRWRGSKLLMVSMVHPTLLLSTHLNTAMITLVKILESKCYISNYDNPTAKEVVCLKSCIECLSFLINQIRGKPALTREVLTPKLSNIISTLIELIPILPLHSLSVLYELLNLNSTTFRPFGKKFENALLVLINNGENINKYEPQLKDLILKSYSLIRFNLSREKSNELWVSNISGLISDVRNVLTIYEEFLDLSTDKEYITRIGQLKNVKDSIFPSLNININESSIEVFKISNRIKLLIELIISQLNVNSPVIQLPVGQLITIVKIILSYNLIFTPISKDIRDISTIEMIKQSITEIKHEGIKLLGFLTDEFGTELLPFLKEFVSLLNANIPILIINKKIKINETEILNNEMFILEVLEVSSKLFQITERFNDMSLLNNLIDCSVFLKNSRLPKLPKDSIVEKGKKGKNRISNSDVLSHFDKFKINVPERTVETIRKFFNTLIRKCELSNGKLNKIIRFLLLDSINNLENPEVVKYLESLLLFPGKLPNSVSILPMIANLIGDKSDIFSLLTNPRFPVLPRKIENMGAVDFEEESEESEEEDNKTELPTEFSDISAKREAATQEESESKRQKVEATTEKVLLSNQEFTFSNNESANEAIAKLQKLNDEEARPVVGEEQPEQEKNTIQESNTDTRGQDENAGEGDHEDEDDGSDFEMPEINVD